MKTNYFFALVTLGVLSVAQGQEPVSPQITQSDTKCIQLKKEPVGSREACVRKAYEVLECQFNREAQEKHLSTKLDRSKVRGQAKVKQIALEENGKKGKVPVKYETLSYGFFDKELKISISARATWWAAEGNCAY